MATQTIFDRYGTQLSILAITISTVTTVTGLFATAIGLMLLQGAPFELQKLWGVPILFVGILLMFLINRLNRRNPFRIDLRDDARMEYWTHKLGVSKPALEGAIKAAGPKTKDIKKYLNIE